MDNIVLFNISIDQETHLWNIESIDPAYSILNEYQIMGGNQFIVMQEITDALAKEYGKVAAFTITHDGPELKVVKIENAYVLHKE